MLMWWWSGLLDFDGVAYTVRFYDESRLVRRRPHGHVTATNGAVCDLGKVWYCREATE
jgi:hypothetical protein